MPAQSEKQRRAAGAALSAKQGGVPTSSLMGPAKSMLGMTEEQLRDYARKPRTTRQVAGLSASSNPHKKHKKGRRRK